MIATKIPASRGREGVHARRFASDRRPESVGEPKTSSNLGAEGFEALGRPGVSRTTPADGRMIGWGVS